MLYVNFFKNLDFFRPQVEAASSPEKLASTHQTSHCHIWEDFQGQGLPHDWVEVQAEEFMHCYSVPEHNIHKCLMQYFNNRLSV
jgi:hypothetical protein